MKPMMMGMMIVPTVYQTQKDSIKNSWFRSGVFDYLYITPFDLKITMPSLQVIGCMMIVQIIYFFIVRKNYLLEIKRGLIL